MAVYQYAKPGEEPQCLMLNPHSNTSVLFKNSRSKYHVPDMWKPLQSLIKRGLKIQPRGIHTKTQKSSAISAYPKTPKARHIRERRHPDLLFHDRLLRHRQAEMLQQRTPNSLHIQLRQLFDTTTTTNRRRRPRIYEGRCCAVPNVLSPRDSNIEPKLLQRPRNTIFESIGKLSICERVNIEPDIDDQTGLSSA